MTVSVLPLVARGRKSPPAFPALPEETLSWLAGKLGAKERLAMREICERADLIYVDGQAYLVAPVSSYCIDTLAQFEAEGEDREGEP